MRTNSDIEKAVKNVARKAPFGGFTRDFYDRHKNDDDPSSMTIIRRFGCSWEEISRIVTGTSSKIRDGSTGLDEISRLMFEHNNYVTRKMYDMYRLPGSPSSATLIRRYGSGWRDVLENI